MSSSKRLRHRRVYYRAAVEKRARHQLKDALKSLRSRCLPSRQAPPGADDLHRAMLAMTFWPSNDELTELDLRVKELALIDREKVPNPLWKAFELVNKRWPGFRLIRRLDALVSRARNLLNETGESDLTWVRREARGSGERASEAKRFLADLRTLQKNPKVAAKIKWEQYERFLSTPGLNKRVQLWCGDHAASRRVVCYARALEMIVDDERLQPFRDQAEPLLTWIAPLGNPAYLDILSRDDFFKLIAERAAVHLLQERAERNRAQGRDRQKRFRARKITR